jgi:hypothetical protein
MIKEKYLQLMSDEYFYVCKDRSVIEIGPSSTAMHTNLIINHKPTYFTAIESDQRSADILKNLTGIDKLIVDDAICTLHETHQADVVVCCGVLYHLHSPLHLLELITNNCDPKYVILDCVIDQKIVQFLPEEDNITGNRYTKNGWKSAKFNLVIPFEIINLSMQNMGFKLINKNLVQVTDWAPKNNSWIAMWEQQGKK